MRIRHRRLKANLWNRLSPRAKWIGSISLVLAGLCGALSAVSLHMPNETSKLYAQAYKGANELLKTIPQTQAQDQAPSSRFDAPPCPAILQEVDGYPVIAKLSIEKLSLELPIIGEIIEEAPNVALCLYSAPTKGGNLVIFAHNDKDGVQFGQLNKLIKGDQFLLTDKWGDSFFYEVYDIEIVASNDIAALETHEDESDLSLLTNTNDGSKRLLFRCRMVETATMQCE